MPLSAPERSAVQADVDGSDLATVAGAIGITTAKLSNLLGGGTELAHIVNAVRAYLA